MRDNNNALLALVATAIGVWIVLTLIDSTNQSEPRTLCQARNQEAKERLYGSPIPKWFNKSDYDLYKFVNGRCIEITPRG